MVDEIRVCDHLTREEIEKLGLVYVTDTGTNYVIYGKGRERYLMHQYDADTFMVILHYTAQTSIN